jgi:hypothetical protein
MLQQLLLSPGIVRKMGPRPSETCKTLASGVGSRKVLAENEGTYVYAKDEAKKTGKMWR